MTQPPRLETYRRIGPFDADSLPRGLLSEHRLKPGSWGRVEVLSGSITMVWDDGTDEPQQLSAGDVVLVPPERPHHLVEDGPFTLAIEFQRDAAD